MQYGDQEEPHQKRRIDFTNQEFPEYNFPSVNALMLSAADVYGNKAIAILLTGMGKDGMLGMQAMHRKNAMTIAQDEKRVWYLVCPKLLSRLVRLNGCYR